MDDDSIKDTQIVALNDELSSDADEAMIGRVVAGKYRVTRRLARGGMGVVYVAEHTTLGREVVFKVLSYHLTSDIKAKSRFEREARGLSVLDHPNIVTVHDFGVENELTYIVMEYVPGENLSQRIRRKGRLTYDELLPIFVQTIEALAAAHAKGIVHRDIKPSNIVITKRAGREDYVKVLDFGLAKLASSSIDITKGNLVGTVSYLAPEVIRGKEATPASDVYALGVMFYYLLSGSKPFTAADEMSVLYQHVNVMADSLHEIVPVGEAPAEFLDFIHQCMAKDPADRPQTAALMHEMLGELVSMPSISAWSIDSSVALPRYQPPDSSAETVAAKLRETSPSGMAISGGRSFHESSSGDIRGDSQLSIVRHRRRQRKQILAIGFTTCSVGLAIAAAVGAGNLSKKASEPSPAVTTPAPAASALFELHTTPPGSVSVDGVVRGRTPTELELEPGTHMLTVEEPGYDTWSQTVHLEAGDNRRVDVYLTQQSETPGEAAKAEGETAEPAEGKSPSVVVRSTRRPPVRGPAVPRAPEETVEPAREKPATAAQVVEPDPEPSSAGSVPHVAPSRGSKLLPTDRKEKKLLPIE